MEILLGKFSESIKGVLNLNFEVYLGDVQSSSGGSWWHVGPTHEARASCLIFAAKKLGFSTKSQLLDHIIRHVYMVIPPQLRH